MALVAIRKPADCIVDLKDPEEGLFPTNHIFEPEYHQDLYVSACSSIAAINGAFKVGDSQKLESQLHRGIQPAYADDENDPQSLRYEGMIDRDGRILTDLEKKLNVCALTSACVRFGFIDTGLARSVSRSFHKKVEHRAAVKKNDVLVNSTGDGTIGRVAVYDFDFPAVVDGHVTIIRYKDPILAWYVAAYLLSDNGQLQIYRYINGSSGQVEIYPQDIERLWVKPAPEPSMKNIGRTLQLAAANHHQFAISLRKALAGILTI